MNNTNLILSIILSIAIIIGWQYFYEKPRLNNLAKQQSIEAKEKEALINTQLQHVKILNVDEALLTSPRIKIKNNSILGSINLVGARIDDILLLGYKRDIGSDQKVRLLAPSNTAENYFIELGWYSANPQTKLPNHNTLWHAENNQLTPESPLTLKWTNPDLVEFKIELSLDEEFMLFAKQTITNRSNAKLDVKSYALINRNYDSSDKNDTILHKGPIGVIDNELKEYKYADLKDKKKETLKDAAVDWLGITDKYWLTSILPDQNHKYLLNLHSLIKDGADKIQIDLLSDSIEIAPNDTVSLDSKIFIGAKKVKLLDQYVDKHNIKLFDRAIDFGWLYLLTKPLFYVLNFFYGILGNFGLSIMLVTILLKSAMFGLSSKSSKSMKKLKSLQPEIEKIKTRYAEDKMRLNQEIMSFYKRENVNPFSGCLPLIIQIPVFFAIYKVLYVTIEMRQAPFFGWIGDLSAPDPTSIFNLFGLLPFIPPSFLHIGIWPILMSLSMFVQQKVSGTTATDPVQEQTMKLLPLIFLFMFSGFPAGLLIYWTWSNLLSILQQLYVNKYTKI
jgi:YidC/Oxa1 family membrane protein insertase